MAYRRTTRARSSARPAVRRSSSARRSPARKVVRRAPKRASGRRGASGGTHTIRLVIHQPTDAATVARPYAVASEPVAPRKAKF